MQQLKKYLKRYFSRVVNIPTAIIILLGGILIVTKSYNTSLLSEVQAQVDCPEGYTTQQCYDYLQQLKNKYANERAKLQREINQLKSRSRSLQTTLNLTKREIQLIQLDINEKQLNIKLLSNEINILEENIEEIQSRLDQQQQEAEHIMKRLDEYMLLRYSLDTLSWDQVILQGDIYSFFELMTYLDYFLAEYENQLNYLKLIKSHIEQQKQLLEEKQEEIYKKQNELESQLKQLTEQKKLLAQKQAEQEKILQEIEKAYQNYLARLNELNGIVNQIDSSLSVYLEKLYQEGKLANNGDWVPQGAIIGFQGHTGCSFGSHLHFELFEIVGNSWKSRNVTWRGYLKKNGRYLVSGTGRAPLDGAYITQSEHGRGNALDLISTTAGNHSGDKYCKRKDEIRCPSRVYNYSWYQSLFNNDTQTACFNLNGEGAPVYAVHPGRVIKGVDTYGSNYAIVINDDQKVVSIYYHLK